MQVNQKTAFSSLSYGGIQLLVLNLITPTDLP